MKVIGGQCNRSKATSTLSLREARSVIAAAEERAAQIARVVIFAAGVPLSKNGEVIGGLGVSGGSGAREQQVAEAGLRALGQPSSRGKGKEAGGGSKP